MNNSNYFDLSGVPTVVGTGLIALDVVVNHATKTAPKVFAGGTCGNVMTILSYLGWLSYPVARMDCDAASKHVLADFQKWGVQADLCKCLPSGETPIVIQNIRRAPGGHNVHRFSFTCPNCGAWLPGFKPVTTPAVEVVLAKVSRPKVFFFDRLSRAAVNLAKAYSDRGALIVFEPSGLGDPKLFQEVLQIVHILKYSNERLNEMSDLHFAQAPLLTIETLGNEGLRYRCSIRGCKTSDWVSLNAFGVKQVVDTAGAGDWCTAGLIHLLGTQGAAGFAKASSASLRDALLFGQALAAWNCQFEGARGGMYATDKMGLHRDVNKILLGEAQTLAPNAGPGLLIKAPVFRCSARECAKRAQDRGVKVVNSGTKARSRSARIEVPKKQQNHSV